eukprot:226802-Chlamydomonas_euryale.AAC.1
MLSAKLTQNGRSMTTGGGAWYVAEIHSWQPGGGGGDAGGGGGLGDMGGWLGGGGHGTKCTPGGAQVDEKRMLSSHVMLYVLNTSCARTGSWNASYVSIAPRSVPNVVELLKFAPKPKQAQPGPTSGEPP